MANYVLSKGFPVLSTYNGSAAAGVTPFRCVKLSGSAIDLNATAATPCLGIVQEAVDQVKVAYGKVVANVALQGISKAYVASGGTLPVLGDVVTAGAAGGVTKALTGDAAMGRIVGPLNTTIAAGDLVDVELFTDMSRLMP